MPSHQMNAPTTSVTPDMPHPKWKMLGGTVNRRRRFIPCPALSDEAMDLGAPPAFPRGCRSSTPCNTHLYIMPVFEHGIVGADRDSRRWHRPPLPRAAPPYR